MLPDEQQLRTLTRIFTSAVIKGYDINAVAGTNLFEVKK